MACDDLMGLMKLRAWKRRRSIRPPVPRPGCMRWVSLSPCPKPGYQTTLVEDEVHTSVHPADCWKNWHAASLHGCCFQYYWFDDDAYTYLNTYDRGRSDSMIASGLNSIAPGGVHKSRIASLRSSLSSTAKDRTAHAPRHGAASTCRECRERPRGEGRTRRATFNITECSKV
jgi:hypothetical protein